MERKTVRTGMVGAGFAANFHYEALMRVHCVDVDVAGVYAIDADMAETYGRQRGVKVYGSLEGLIDDVDVIHVLVPPVAHEQIAVAALARDTFAVVEKPLTGSEVFQTKPQLHGQAVRALQIDRFRKFQ